MRRFLLACSMFALAVAARAATVDDVLDMTKKGEPEDKIIAAVEATQGDINVGVSDVLRLRDAKVSDKVLLAMLRHSGGDKAAVPPPPNTPNAPEPRIVERPAPQIQPAAPRREAAPPTVIRDGPVPENGLLSIDNLDDRPWSYMYEPAIQTIWISPAANDGRGTVRGHTSLTLSMKAGSYKIRFVGTQDEGLPITVYGGEKSGINLTHVVVEGSDSLYATAFERGERKGNAKLVALDKLPAQAQNEVVVQREVVEAPVYYSDAPVYYYGGPSVYYYGGSRYYRPYYGGGYYGGGYYGGNRLNFNFGYSSGGYRGGHRR